MAGLPWLKVYSDLPRDPRSLILGDILGDPRGWTYVVQFRMYLADKAPTGRLSGTFAAAAFERCAGWAGDKGALLQAMRDAGFIRVGPARDGEGTEIEDLDWAREQGAHVAKVERDAKKPRGNAPNVVSPSRDDGGTSAGPAPTPRGKSREMRVESREERKDLPPSAGASAGNGQGELLPDVPPTPPTKPAKKAKEAKKPEAQGDPRHNPLIASLTAEGWPFDGGKDAAHVKALLALADQQEATRGEMAGLEVLRRARIAWGQFPGFNSARTLGDFRAHWGRFAETERRGVGAQVPDGLRPSAPDSCRGCGAAGQGGMVGEPEVWLGYECGCLPAFTEAQSRGLHFTKAAEWAAARKRAA